VLCVVDVAVEKETMALLRFKFVKRTEAEYMLLGVATLDERR
jgi:hypothetical protein